MGRKNNRANLGYEPLDLTNIVQHKAIPARETNDEARQRAAWWWDEREKRQREARALQGIDWSICLVPGCGADLWRERDASPETRKHDERLPLCLKHLAVAAAQARPSKDDPLMVSAVAEVLSRRAASAEAREAKRKRERLACIDGHIYFIRLNGLIKVGWSRDIAQRINSYGPRVEVLALYPGTRDDETNLHRQLKPARALGREWYEDGPILADFIRVAIETHGPPREIRTWLSEPKQIVAGKRHR